MLICILIFGKYVLGGKYRQVGVEVILLIQLTTTQRPTPSLLCLSPFVVLAADGLAHKAGHCWPRCHSNQEILTAVSGVVCEFVSVCARGIERAERDEWESRRITTTEGKDFHLSPPIQAFPRFIVQQEVVTEHGFYSCDSKNVLCKCTWCMKMVSKCNYRLSE